MRPLLRGIIAAVALSLAPVAVVTTSAASANAVVAVNTVVATSSAGEARAQAPRVKMRRTITFKDVSRGAKGRGKFRVTPNFEGKRLLVQTKKNGNFRTTRKVKTDRRGKAIISFAATVKGIAYRIVAPGSKKFRTATLKVTYRRY